MQRGLSCLKSKHRISQGKKISGREPWQQGNSVTKYPLFSSLHRYCAIIIINFFFLELSVAEMDSSKILPASEECSSSESGWTMYIASPDLEHDYADKEDDDVDMDANRGQQGFRKRAEIEEAADSDDSMASDASSGPSDQRYSSYDCRGIGHAGSNNERTSVAKNHNHREEKKKQIKGEKGKSGNKANSGGRLKKF